MSDEVTLWTWASAFVLAVLSGPTDSEYYLVPILVVFVVGAMADHRRVSEPA